MSNRLGILLLVIAAFGVLTTLALLDVGYFGILAPHFKSYGEAQVLADLVIMGLLACIWMVRDARDSGIPAWPFILVTLMAGSFGPLLYLVVCEWRTSARHPAAA